VLFRSSIPLCAMFLSQIHQEHEARTKKIKPVSPSVFTFAPFGSSW
jgi:hypothetical protein